jgi:hypothetical protein
MNFIKRKSIRISAMLIAIGFPVVAPKIGAAQGRNQESHSIQAAPDLMRGNSGRAGNQNRGRTGSMGRGNKNGRLNNNFGQSWARNRDDRFRHRRDLHNHNFGFNWGTPYSGFYPYGYYGEGYYNGPPPYNGGSAYDAGYNDGFNAAQFDRSQGNLYNPRQYERSGNPDYFEGFVAGYEDGYRS